MATIKIKRNKSDASAKPTSLQEGELAVNLLDKSLFSGNGSAVVKLYTGEDKYFNEDGFANKALDATKLGGQLPSYYATASALEALRGEIGGGADTSNLATKEELAECEEVAAAALNELNGKSISIQSELAELKESFDVSLFATKEELTVLENSVVENEEICAAALNELNDRIKALEQRIKELENANQNI